MIVAFGHVEQVERAGQVALGLLEARLGTAEAIAPIRQPSLFAQFLAAQQVLDGGARSPCSRTNSLSPK